MRDSLKEHLLQRAEIRSVHFMSPSWKYRVRRVTISSLKKHSRLINLRRIPVSLFSTPVSLNSTSVKMSSTPVSLFSTTVSPISTPVSPISTPVSPSSPSSLIRVRVRVVNLELAFTCRLG